MKNCMLAKVYSPAKPLLFPQFVQPKLDGFRCLATMRNGKVECWSRPSRKLPEGKRFETTDHIERELEKVMLEGDIFDGELYLHGATFSHIAHHVKSIKENTNVVQYHVYDAMREGNTEERLLFVYDRLEGNDFKFVKRVLTDTAFNLDTVMDLHKCYLIKGYEGSILRAHDGLYENKRSAKLLKLKDFEDAEFEIIGWKEGIGKEAGFVIWECKTIVGDKFWCRPEGAYIDRVTVDDNPDSYRGKFLTVRFFGYGTHGAPRFPVGMRIKEDF